MILFFSVFVALAQTISVNSFLLNTNKPLLTNFSSSSSGYDANTVAYMLQKMDLLQMNIQQQNKTLQTQATIIQNLLNFTQQSPSTQSLRSDISLLQVYVQRIMDEYHRLTNISNATDLAMKINKMANSVHFLSSSLITQESKINNVEAEFRRQISILNGTILSTLSQTTSQVTTNINSISAIKQSLNTLSSKEHNNENRLTTLSSDLHTTQSRLSSLQSTVSQDRQHTSHQLSVLSTQYSSVSGRVSDTLSRLNTNITSMDSRVHNLEVEVIPSVRLVGGSHTGEGRVEVKYHNAWGTVCDDLFTDTNAEVICRQLGFAWTGAIQKQSAPFGQGGGTTVLDNVICRGPEKSIAGCKHNEFAKEDCSHSEDVGIVCFSVRLSGGSSSREGTVVVRLGNTDGSVCDDSWDNDDARVVCRMLGYHGTAEAVSSARFGERTGQIWMDDVSCGGSETSLAHCSFSGFGTHDCSHSEDAGVICHL
ncbi:deleted in malignant brain tumors 1 protein-like [Saccostrea echinata]|uniref:deleted in malignant brain tumors 1 protein-like n=1 Tax=Saccostrea echinata TaxID=191078 RepID=UPI002A81E14B|nr:deleted in malignant brain tumors 1 protein-like [Saccostrea echinata]